MWGSLLVAGVVVATGFVVVRKITEARERLMATIDEIRQAQADQNAALTEALQRVAEDVQHLVDRGGATPEELSEVLTSIQGVTTTLQGVDPDPSFPPAPEPGPSV